MKKLFIISIVFLMAGICFGQEEKQKTLFVNGKDINKLGLEYIEISCYTTSMYGKNWAVNFDIGEEYVNWKGHRYTDENGNVIDFESPMDAVNFVIKCGWEFVSNNGGAAGNVTNLYYLMRKKKTLIKENP